MKSILVTGGAGFIGSNFIPFFLENNAEYHIVNLDALTYAGNLDNLSEVKNNTSYTFNKRPVELVFCEEFLDVNQAISFEKQIKGWSRKKKRQLLMVITVN